MIIFIITISYIIGILWGLYLKISIIPFLLPLILFISRKELFTSKKKNPINKKINKMKLAIFLIPCIISNIHILYLENSFESKYTNIPEEVTIIGTVVSNAEEKQYSYQYKLKVEHLISSKGEEKQCKDTYVLLKVKKDETINYNNKRQPNTKEAINYNDKVESDESTVLKYADKILIKGNFELAKEATNYGGFNYRQYLKTKNIHGIVTTQTSKIKIIKENNVNFINLFANNTSVKIKENIEKLLPENQASLLTGILIGDKTNLSEEIQEDFKDSNLSHMLAISGAHVSYIILGLTFLLNKIGKKISKILTIIILIFFTILTGMTPSVQRAVIMSIYILVGSLLYKKPNILISISLSMLILLLENPYNLFDIGFQLSYGGTIGIILLNRKIKLKKSKIKIVQKIKEMMIITLSANIIIIPIMMFHYNTISLTFLISNILASPILGIVIILGFIIILISFILNSLNTILAPILEIFLNILICIANFSSKLPFSKVYVITPTMLQIILYYLYIMMTIFKRKSKKFILIILIFTLIYPRIHIFPENFKIYFIDVGQGDSTLITTPYGKNILIDGGGSKDLQNYDIGKDTLLPYLLDRRVDKIDFLLISHFDSDHVRRFVNNT